VFLARFRSGNHRDQIYRHQYCRFQETFREETLRFFRGPAEEKRQWRLRGTAARRGAGQGRQGARCGTPNRSGSFLPTPRCPRGAARARLGRPRRPGRAKCLQPAAHMARQAARGGRAARPGARRGRALSHHMTLCPRRALARRRARCVLRGQPFVSVLGNLVDLNVSGRRARQEPLTGLQNTRKVLSLCPLTMAYSWSGALGPRVVPRAAHAVNSCLSVLSGLGVARMGRLACVFRALLCWGCCARD